MQAPSNICGVGTSPCYYGWYKKVYNAAYEDPSINEVIITTDSSWAHSIGSTTDSGEHRLQMGNGGVSEIYYLMWAGTTGHEYSTSDFTNAMNIFLSSNSSPPPAITSVASAFASSAASLIADQLPSMYAFTDGTSGYYGWYKKVYNAAYEDPSINEVIITTDSSWAHSIGSTTDSGEHRLQMGNGGVSEIYYLMWAGTTGHEYSTSDFTNAMNTFLSQVRLTSESITSSPPPSPPPPFPSPPPPSPSPPPPSPHHRSILVTTTSIPVTTASIPFTTASIPFTVFCKPTARDRECYYGWYKKVYNAAYEDPSINEVIITTDSSWAHSIGSTTDSGEHRLQMGNGGVSEIYYLMWAGTTGHEYSTSDFTNAMNTFLSQDVVCKMEHNTDPDSNDDGTWERMKHISPNTLDHCKQLCEEYTGTCYGVEYLEDHARCDIFTEEFTHVKRKKGRMCSALSEDSLRTLGSYRRSRQGDSSKKQQVAYVFNQDGMIAAISAICVIMVFVGVFYRRRRALNERRGEYNYSAVFEI
ncbi:hypothetical protein CYMTET_7598 [Cymbomonas tetramitiformis]|uniref:Uncharacterized protein n=1 Tax=Cymbomonas tetramitiformis TaxID=36881 RepID=A0AAE0GVD4_9CHLO|nr:hypothetical protein CYMTET_7598 [Cymbomonas tetramitiformis]